MRPRRMAVVFVATLALATTSFAGTATADDPDDLVTLERFWAEAYGPETAVEAEVLAPETLELRSKPHPQGPLDRALLAKAEPDECYYDIGDPRNLFGAEDCEDGRWKVNQAYVWGLAESRNTLWFGTAPNVHCLVVGGFLSVTVPHETDSWVCEFGESKYSPPLPAAAGDWRPPQIFALDLETGALTERTPADPLLARTTGIRSAGSLERVAFLAGPGLLGGINLFAYDAKTGAYLGSANLPAYDNIRKWLVVDGVLYTAVGRTGGGGRVLRWTGDRVTPFSFVEVGVLGSEGSELAYHEGRLFVSTWPELAGPGSPRLRSASLWMSPLIPFGGLTADQAAGWQQVWSAFDYEPDPVTAMTYGGGALASYEGALYWGTMHVPFVATVAHDTAYGDPADATELLTTMLGTHRAINLFRGDDFGTGSQDVELLYGMARLPAYDPVAGWQLVPNRMGEVPRFGPAGVWNFFNNYTWTMEVYRGDLFVGTMDWSYLFRGMLQVLADQAGVEMPEIDVSVPFQFFGADLFRFRDPLLPASAESIDGVGNYSSYGIRTMVTTGVDLYLGMANPMNLLTDPDDDLPEGGWELLRLSKPSDG